MKQDTAIEPKPDHRRRTCDQVTDLRGDWVPSLQQQTLSWRPPAPERKQGQNQSDLRWCVWLRPCVSLVVRECVFMRFWE